MKNLVDEFNKTHDDIYVDRQRIPWDQYYTKFYTSLTSRTPPDLAIAHASRLRPFVDYLRPYEEIDVSRYLPVTHDQVTFDGKVLALPLDIHAVANYYNKQIFEEAGLDPENPPTSWEPFKRAMNTIAEETDYYAFDPGDGGHGLRSWLAWLRSSKEQFLTNVATDPQPAFNTQDGRRVTQVFDDMVSKWNWTDKSAPPAYDGFNTGITAVTMDGTWAYSRYKESADNIDFPWGVFTVSIAPTKERNMTSGDSHTLIMPNIGDRTQKETEAALTVAEWLSTNVNWPLNSGHVPSTKENLQSSKLRSSKVWEKTLHLFAKQAANENVAYEPATEHNQRYRLIMGQMINAVRTQIKSPEKALRDAEQQLQRVFL